MKIYDEIANQITFSVLRKEQFYYVKAGLIVLKHALL